MSLYKRLNWGDIEMISTDKLNQMANNTDYVYEHAINGFYDVNGLVRDSGLSIRAGYIKIANTTDSGQNVSYFYSKPFLVGAIPVVVNSWTTDSYIGVTLGVKGLDGAALPDHRGFLALLFDTNKAANIGAGDFKGSTYYGFISIAPSG